MKKIFIPLFLTMIHLSNIIYSQEPEVKKKLKRSDMLSIQLFYDIWDGVPINITPNWRQFGFSTHLQNDFPLGTSGFSFAFGTGLSAHNFYSNGVITYDTNNVTQYAPIPEHVFSIIDSSFKKISYSINKHTFLFSDALVEFRFRTKSNVPFKFYSGFMFGIMLHEHTKYVGDDYITLTDNVIKYKEYKHHNLSFYRYGPYLKVGFSRFTFYFLYSLTETYKKDKGPQLKPFTLGINISII